MHPSRKGEMGECHIRGTGMGMCILRWGTDEWVTKEYYQLRFYYLEKVQNRGNISEVLGVDDGTEELM